MKHVLEKPEVILNWIFKNNFKRFITKILLNLSKISFAIFLVEELFIKKMQDAHKFLITEIIIIKMELIEVFIVYIKICRFGKCD